MTRRELLRALGTSALLAGPAASGPAGASQNTPRAGGGVPHQVGVSACPSYDREALLEAVRAGWRLSRPPDVRGKRVVLKPNIADFLLDRPIHTDARLVEAIVIHLKSLGAAGIVIAEGPPHDRDSESLFRRTGFEALAERQGLRLVDLNYDDTRLVKNANARATRLREFHVPATILAADVLISVPKMKTHRLAGVTLGLKNMFGILPGIVYGWPKNVLHWNGIPQSICDINGTVKPSFVLIDGIVGMEGYGPILGSARKAGVLVMSANALAADATAARIMGIEPARVEYLAMAQRARLGSLRPQDISVAGERLSDVRTDFALEPEYAYLRAPKN